MGRKRFFFEKRSKKLLLNVDCDTGVATSHISRSFLASFFAKKEELS
jgi:hypothetical protein